MRRLPILVLFLLALSLLTVAPVSAVPADSGVQVLIAVPVNQPDDPSLVLDSDIDLVVAIGKSDYTIEAQLGKCHLWFPPGTYEVRRLAMTDKSAGTAGLQAGVITSEPLKAGTRIRDMVRPTLRICPVNGLTYLVYLGFTE